MKKCAKVFSMVLTFTLVLSVFAETGCIQAKPAVKVSSIKITNTKKKFRIQKGKTVILNTSVKVSPNKSKYKKVTFRSSKPNIVSINAKGLMRAKKAGTAKITVTSAFNAKKRVTIPVTVTADILVKKIVLNKTSITVDENSEEDIKLQVKQILPRNAKNTNIEWDTDDDEVADIDDDGTLIIGEAGETVITAYAADEGGAYAECEIIVTGDDSDDDSDDDDDGYDDFDE